MEELLKELRGWLVENHDLSADASDTEVWAKARELMKSGDLDTETYEELVAAAANNSHKARKGQIEKLEEQLAAERDPNRADLIRAQLKFLRANRAGTKSDLATLDSAVGRAVGRMHHQGGSNVAKENERGGSADPEKLFGGAAGGASRTRVEGRSPSERYSDTRYAAKHARFGMPVYDTRGLEVTLPSERDCSKFGVFLKWRASRGGLPVSLSEHERSLMEEVYADPWAGVVNGVHRTGISGAELKSLLLDGTSGGQELSPEFFDSMIVTVPLLHSELLPFIHLRDVPRGNNIETASINHPTLTWGTTEGSAITLFDTANLVAEITAAVANLMIGLEVGRDLLADSAVEIGQTLVQLIGERQLQTLDDKIISGSGSGEPLGILNSSGTNIITQQSPSPTGWDVNDVEALLFGINKAYRANRGPSVRFIMTDVSYRRICSLPVGSTDARRVLMPNQEHEDYMLLRRPVSINNTMGNANVVFGDLRKYRLWRRQGSEVRWSAEGETLMKKNTALLVVRSRWAGKPVDPAGFAELNTAQS